MNWYKKAQNKKTLYIMRGIAGSGKSTLANELGQNGIVLGSDDFFMVNGKYEFDPDALDYAHWWNQGRVKEAMKKGISPIVADNTNTQAWEMKPYVLLAQKYNYDVQIREPNTPWKFDVEELAKRNTHGVPKDIIEKMIQKWEPDVTLDDIMKSEKPK